jgi:hypothetical protein
VEVLKTNLEGRLPQQLQKKWPPPYPTKIYGIVLTAEKIFVAGFADCKLVPIVDFLPGRQAVPTKIGEIA